MFCCKASTVLIQLSELHLSGRSLIQEVSFEKKMQKKINVKHKHFCVIQIFKLVRNDVRTFKVML